MVRGVKEFVEIKGDFEGAVDLPIFGTDIRSLGDAVGFTNVSSNLAQNLNYRYVAVRHGRVP